MNLEVHATKGEFSRVKNQEQMNKYLNFASLSSIAPSHESESCAKPRSARSRAKTWMQDVICQLENFIMILHYLLFDRYAFFQN